MVPRKHRRTSSLPDSRMSLLEFPERLEKGKPGSSTYRILFHTLNRTSSRDTEFRQVSPWCDIPVYMPRSQNFNFICLNPSSNQSFPAIYILAMDEPWHPIRALTKEESPFAYEGQPVSWNFGFLPQTWTSKSPVTFDGCEGPLPAIVLSSRRCVPGQIFPIKLIGAFASVGSNGLVTRNLIGVAAQEVEFSFINSLQDLFVSHSDTVFSIRMFLTEQMLEVHGGGGTRRDRYQPSPTIVSQSRASFDASIWPMPRDWSEMVVNKAHSLWQTAMETQPSSSSHSEKLNLPSPSSCSSFATFSSMSASSTATHRSESVPSHERYGARELQVQATMDQNQEKFREKKEKKSVGQVLKFWLGGKSKPKEGKNAVGGGGEGGGQDKWGGDGQLASSRTRTLERFGTYSARLDEEWLRDSATSQQRDCFSDEHEEDDSCESTNDVVPDGAHRRRREFVSLVGHSNNNLLKSSGFQNLPETSIASRHRRTGSLDCRVAQNCTRPVEIVRQVEAQDWKPLNCQFTPDSWDDKDIPIAQPVKDFQKILRSTSLLQSSNERKLPEGPLISFASVPSLQSGKVWQKQLTERVRERRVTFELEPQICKI